MLVEVFSGGSDNSSGGSKRKDVWADPIRKFDSVRLRLVGGGFMEV